MISLAKREVLQQKQRECLPMRRSVVTWPTAAILMGAIFGAYPANRAAHPYPVEPLKYE